MWAVVATVLVSAVAPAAPQGDADTREIAAYRLSMDVVNQVAAATRAMVVELRRDPHFQEIAKLDAEIAALEKKEEKTEAEDARLEQLRTRKEEAADALKGPSFDDAKSLTEMDAQIRRVPSLMAGLRWANMTPRDYAKFMLASIQAGMVAGLKKQGLLKELPKDVPVENVRFMETHEAELQALQKELAALGGEAP